MRRREVIFLQLLPLTFQIKKVGTGEGRRTVDEEADNKSADEDRWLVVGGERRGLLEVVDDVSMDED